MAVTLSDLLVPLTREGVVRTALGILSAAGFPTTSWGSTSIPRTLIEFFAEVVVDLSGTVTSIARMALLETAEGQALTLHAQDAYDETRKTAIATKGTRTLVESAGSPQSWGAGELVIVCSSDASLVYRNEAAVTLAANGSTAVTFAAESPGAKYNVDGSTVGSLATPVPGVAITATTGADWITQSGADEESDEALRIRCRAKWATLTTTGPIDAYRKWALDASSEITRVRVQEDPLAVPPDPSVSVILASTTGAATSGAVTAANAAVQLRRPLGVNVEVVSAVAYPVTIGGVVKVRTAYRTAAEPAVRAALMAYFAGLDIGEAVYVSQIIEHVMAAPGVVTFAPKKGDGSSMVPGTDDVLPAANGVATLTDLITFENV